MTRRILPVVGSRSTRAEEGANCLGMALEMASLEVVEVLDFLLVVILQALQERVQHYQFQQQVIQLQSEVEVQKEQHLQVGQMEAIQFFQQSLLRLVVMVQVDLTLALEWLVELARH